MRLPANYSFMDVQPKRGLLNEIKGTEGKRRISGTTDVVISETKHVTNDAVRHSVEALLELKKPMNMQYKDHNPQTICKYIAASYLNRNHGVVSVLTDLNRSWIFYWFAENKGGSGVALHKLKLQEVEGAAELAKYILESLNDETRRETLPTTFVDRLSFDAIMDRITQDHDHNRERRDAHGGSGGSSYQDQDRKPAGWDHEPPLSGSGDSSSGMGFRNSGDAGDANYVTDVAKALRRFAPHSDVSNELDLLDMVDETEEYEIIRNFAAKHIVPYTTGQTM